MWPGHRVTDAQFFYMAGLYIYGTIYIINFRPYTSKVKSGEAEEHKTQLPVTVSHDHPIRWLSPSRGDSSGPNLATVSPMLNFFTWQDYIYVVQSIELILDLTLPGLSLGKSRNIGIQTYDLTAVHQQFTISCD